MTSQKAPLSQFESIILFASMVSIVALATDIMLPALDVMAQDLGVDDANRAQLIISSLFIGFALGQGLAGPLSDCYGRKPIIYIGYLIFLVGTLLCLFTDDFEVMLAGRALQGLGISAPRIVTTAIVRDGYSGRPMARILSFIMLAFILVPTIAPALGQVIVSLSHWRHTFTLLLANAGLVFIWFALRQPETLKAEHKRVFSISGMLAGFYEAATNRAAMGFTLAAGFIFGAFLTFLATAQQVFQVAYDTGVLFSFWFGVASLSIGVSAIVNASLVMRLGMQKLCSLGLLAIVILSVLLLLISSGFDFAPPFYLFMVWLILVFFCFGLIFGNLTALAMETLGHMAGLGSAFYGSVSTLISLPIAWYIGEAFDGTATPLVLGFTVMSVLSLGSVLWAVKGRPDSSTQ